MIGRSRAHLAAAGESYLDHMRFAAVVGLLAIGAGLACLLHAVIPALCERTCSRTIDRLQQLIADREALGRVTVEAEPLLVFLALLFLPCATVVPLVLISGGSLIALSVGALAFAIPVTFVASNPQLS